MASHIISIIIPTKNEARTIERILSETQRYVDKILLIDGHSTDQTVRIAKRFGASIIIQNGTGKGAALREAFSKINGDFILIMDADASMKPKEIKNYVEALRKGAEVVKGSRFMPGGGSEDLNTVRIIGNIFFTKLVNLLWRTHYTDLCYGYVGFRKEALERFSTRLRSTRFEIETEIVIKATKLGLRITEIPSIELKRGYGKSNLSIVRDGLFILFTIIREFSNGKFT